jgi:hypothetical protein
MAILTDVEDIEFVYPSKPWKLPLFCHLWFLFLFAYLYYGHVPDPFSHAYTSTVRGKRIYKLKKSVNYIRHANL